MSCQLRETRSAFTLVELLVIITIVAILISLVIVGLSGSRKVAVDTQCLNNERSCSMAVLAYSGDYKDSFPCFAKRQYSAAIDNGGLLLDYFQQSRHWPLALRGYIGDAPLAQVQLCPAMFRAISPGFPEWFASFPKDYIQPSDYEMGFGFFSDPGMWKTGVPQPLITDSTLLRPVRVDEVTFPSGKGLLIEATSWHQLKNWRLDEIYQSSIERPEGAQASYPIHAVDGSGKYRNYSMLTPGWLQNQPGLTWAPAVLRTSDGARGRDWAGN